MSSVSKRLAFCVIASLVIWLPSPGQQKPPTAQDKSRKQDPPPEDQTIRLGTALITVPFNVTDPKNRYINELSKEDVEILEDNKQQQVFSFERQTDLPITVALLIDISGSQQYTLPIEKAAAARFFRKVLRPNKDLGAVITFEHESVLVQGLTPDVGRLQDALDDVHITAQPAMVTGPTTPPINNSGAGSTAMYDSIYAVSSDLLRREAGRRVVVLITDGVDTSSTIKQKAAIERAWRSEIIIYSIGIGDRIYGGVDSGSLKRISAETGGRAFFPRKEEDLDEAFALIDEDLRSQYLLAYQPNNAVADGSFRTIQVRIKNRKELTVRHRRGYFAPSG